MNSHLFQVNTYLTEDIGMGDVTAALIPAHLNAHADVITREAMVVCGQIWFNAVFYELSEHTLITWQVEEGVEVPAGTLLCHLSGNARVLLSGERTALNWLQTLSATATQARNYANAVLGTGCTILDTRKTLPGLRQAQKYAVSIGGCENHRMGLYDAILIKENHILAAGSIANAIASARQQSQLSVEIEVENLAELEQALSAKPDRIMLDNFSLDDMRAAVALRNATAPNISLEASGNVELTTIKNIALTGVDYISVGALTKNIQAIDLSMRIQLIQE